jgi:DNA-binding NarL/FixJ family response regulator
VSATATMPIRVLVVDDHAVVRDGLSALLDRQGDMRVVGEAATGAEALAAFRRLRPDVTLVDLRLPDMDGAQLIARVRREFPEARALVLTTYDGDEDIYAALRAGARGYLLKDMRRDELVDAVRAVHAGLRRIPPAVALRLAERVAGTDLTSRERQVLELIVAGKSNKEIGAALGLTEGTVKGYVNGMLDKLEVSDRTQAAVAAVRRGIVRLS